MAALVGDQPTALATAAAAATTAAATAATVAAIAAVASNEEEISPEVYIGVVKSYNDRRGFGFLACVETAAKYGRDVYMPKAEATLAAAEYSGLDIDPEGAAAAAAAAAAAEKAAAAALAAAAAEKAATGGVTAASGEKAEKPPPAPRLAEEDLVQFRVRLSVEGYPQAAKVKKLRKFTGIVKQPPEMDGAEESTSKNPGKIESAELAEAHGFSNAPVHFIDCGQVRLAIGDEVTFCVPQVAGSAAGDSSKGPAPKREAPPEATATMVALSKTNRPNGSVLGCFALDLPRTGASEGAPLRPNLILDSHAFGDKLVLAGLPTDLSEAELMRFFSKQGASGAIVAHAKSRSFASVSFPSTTEVARFLGRTAHAFADDKETRIARLLPLNPSADTARLPALPAPSLSVGDEAGSLLVVWSPLVLAVGYSVELRPAGVEGPWAAVEVGSSTLGTTASDNSSIRRFDSDCSSCRVVGLQLGTPYEARVSYFTDCGTRSEASEASEWCMTQTTATQDMLLQTSPAPPLAHAPPPASFPTAHAPPPGTLPGYMPEDLSHAYGVPPLGPPPPVWPPGYPGGPLPGQEIAGHGMLPPTYDGYGSALPAHMPSPGWRSATGMVVPPPARPALRPADEYGFAVSVQWPAVAQAAAYVVELREAGSAAFERFVRSAPEAKLGTLVELRVGGLRPGPPPGRVYVAQVRTVAADGSESAPSAPGWSPPLPSQPTSAVPTAAAASTAPIPTTSNLSADSAPFQPSAAAAHAAAAAVAASGAQPAALPASTAPGVIPGTSIPATQPAVQPPAASGFGNAWAPPPWLGQQPLGPGALGAAPAAPPVAPVASAMPTVAPTSVQSQVAGTATYDQAPKIAPAPWGAPGGPPPPPVGPPPPVQPGGIVGSLPHNASSQQGEVDPHPPEITGNEECLILD